MFYGAKKARPEGRTLKSVSDRFSAALAELCIIGKYRTALGANLWK